MSSSEQSERQPVRMTREQWHITETPDHTPDVHHIHNVDVAHEDSDVNVRAILWFVLGLGIMTAVSFALMGGLYKFFEARELSAEGDPPPLVLQGDERLPPEPRLQLAPGHPTHPLDELKELRAKEIEALTTYGIKDEALGTVRLPISEAQKKFLESNPPVRQQQQPAGASDASDDLLFMDMPSYYSSGRMAEKRRQ